MNQPKTNKKVYVQCHMVRGNLHAVGILDWKTKTRVGDKVKWSDLDWTIKAEYRMFPITIETVKK